MRTRGRGRISAQRAANGKRSRSRERFRHPLVLAIVESWKSKSRTQLFGESSEPLFSPTARSFSQKIFSPRDQMRVREPSKRRDSSGAFQRGSCHAYLLRISRVPGNQSTSTSFRVPPCSLNAAPPSYPRPVPWCPRPGPALAGPEPALSPRACPRATPNASISSPSEIPTVCRQIFRAGASA